MNVHDVVGIVTTVLAVVLTYVCTRWAAERARQQDRDDELVDVVRTLVSSQRSIVDAVRAQGVEVRRPQFPRGW